jgi:hypothetical protein
VGRRPRKIVGEGGERLGRGGMWERGSSPTSELVKEGEKSMIIRKGDK